MENYYEILEISPNASEEVIKMAYKALVKKYHPDVFKGNPEIANVKMQEINRAYEVLADSSKRKSYDSTIKFNNYDRHENEEDDDTDSVFRTTEETESSKEGNNKGSGCFSSITTALFIIFIIPIGVYFLIKMLLWMIKDKQKQKETAITITIILFAAVILWVLKNL